MDIQPEHLKRRTTYREFTAQWLGDESGEITGRALTRVAEQEAAVAARMSPNDELWEWEFGDKALAMRWGLAIVRDGVVIESWLEWMS